MSAGTDSWTEGLSPFEIEFLKDAVTPTWTLARLGVAVRKWKAGENANQIGQAIGLGVSQVSTRISKLRFTGLDLPRRRAPKGSGPRRRRPRPAISRAGRAGQDKAPGSSGNEAAMRKCLTCGEMFKSWGKGNRQCGCRPGGDAAGLVECSALDFGGRPSRGQVAPW